MSVQINHPVAYRGVGPHNIVRLPSNTVNPLLYRPHANPQFGPMQYYFGAPSQRNMYDEEDLASIALQVQRKRFYVDVKRNKKGIFMKIAEVGADGRKARILLTLHAAFEVKDKLKDLIEVLDELSKKSDAETTEDKAEGSDQDVDIKSRDAQNGDGLIKSHIVNYPYRRYFLDLKRNRRGLFLRITMMSTINRIQLAVPSQGMQDLYNAISSLLEKWWDGSKPNESSVHSLPESKSIRFDNKTLYFDSSENQFGTYLRISEVRSNSRTAITIPSRSLTRFRDIINGLTDDLSNVKLTKPTDEESDEKSSVHEPEDSSDVQAQDSTPVVDGDT